MLSNAIRKKLKANWGDKVDSMQCFAEVKLIDPSTDWACWILAMNPDDEDEVIVMTNGYTVAPHVFSLRDLFRMYNTEGKKLEIDEEYRPMKADELYKRLRGL